MSNVLVDTSIWIDFFRGKSSKPIQLFHDMIGDDRIVIAISTRLELLAGMKKKDLVKMQKLFSSLITLYPNEHTWVAIESWIKQGKMQGQHFGIADLIIGALATEHDLSLWSNDDDFRRMSDFGFVTLFEP